MTSSARLDVTLDNGKYRVWQEADGRMRALRYGEEWRNIIGDGLIFSLASEVNDMKERLVAAEERAFIAEKERDEAKMGRNLNENEAEDYSKFRAR